MHFQWYPGHMTKAVRTIQSDLKLIDVVIELVDARIPYSSKNPDIDTLAQNKPRILLLNKCDLADPAQTKKWVSHYEEKGFHVLSYDAKNKQMKKQIDPLIQEVCKDKILRDRKRGILNRPARGLVVGIPNVGKSTFINQMAGKSVTKTGNRPGVTKGKQWIRIHKQLEFLDTPGILWPKFEDQNVGLRLAWIGSIKDDLLTYTDVAMDLITYLKEEYPGSLKGFYGLDESLDEVKGLEDLARIRGCLKKGNELDLDRAARLLLDDFRGKRIGAITLETCDGLK